MNNILVCIITSVIVYLLYLFIIINNKRRLKKYITKGKECTLIKGRYKIDFDKVNHKLVANLFAIDNSIIIGVTLFILVDVKNFILKLLFGFLIFTFLILITYLQIGKYVKSKEEK